MSERIVRIAARGDGVGEQGTHVPFGVPGDVLVDGQLVEGAGHQVPPCRHFPACGGCQLQHLNDAAYADYCESRVAGALAQKDLAADIRPAHLSPPKSRRRATLRALRAGGRIILGFNAAGSNKVVDLTECHVLHPALFAMLASLRTLLSGMQGRAGEVMLTLASQGPDVLVRGFAAEGLEAVEALSSFGEHHHLARLALDEGYGAEVRYEPVPATVSLSGREVPLPVGAFLQATADGEAALVGAVREAAGDAANTADLFAGIGTFAMALGGRVTVAEASRDAVVALKRAAPDVEVQHRDLYRRPFDPGELAAFDAVVLDPPRSGAEEQAKALAASSVPRLAYVSCNPGTFARDARILVDGGYALEWVLPVGQFRWSTHVELVARFTKT